MGWDPAVLRKYNSTGHFRLLNQVRSELKGNPLIRPRDGETVATANRSKSLIRALEVRPSSGGYGRSRRSQQSSAPVAATVAVPVITPVAAQPIPVAVLPIESFENGSSTSFRDRLNAIDMR